MTDHQFHHRDHSPINHPTHSKYKTETLRVAKKFELNDKIKKYLQCREQQCSQQPHRYENVNWDKVVLG